MAHPITFISAASSTRLAKTVTKDKTTPYPNVKNINSYEFQTEATLEGLAERLSYYRQHAAEGFAIYKGRFSRPLVNESRKGLSDRDALTNSFILDIDSWPTDIDLSNPTDETVTNVAESFVALLPSCFHNASYIAHASASFGMKTGKASMHIEFLLEHELSPRALKDYVYWLNLSQVDLASRLELTKSTHAISWILDPSVVDNSKIIYIAPPTFVNCQNPFEDDDQRWVMVIKDQLTLDIRMDVGAVNATALLNEKRKMLKTLRKAAGLHGGEPKTRKINVKGNDIAIIQNPNEMRIELYDITDQYAIFNVNGGDSHAYWCSLDAPDIIYNFKGELPFQFSKADPDGYKAFCEQYATILKNANSTTHEVFYDKRSGKYYIVELDQNTGRVVLNANGSQEFYSYDKSDIENALANIGMPKPDIITTYTMEFMPHCDVIFDKPNRLFNRFMPSELMQSPPDIDEPYKGLSYQKGIDNQISALLRSLCPNIHKIIWHITGNDNECYEHFVNWLAYAYQKRRVSTTAWVMTGVQGTGKGVFFTKVIQKIWGTDYAEVLKAENFEDAYDGNLANKLMICLDEMRMGDSGAPKKMLDRLKSLTGNEVNSFRHMRQERVQMQCFFNFIIFSNHLDAALIENGDRRFNVCPAQTRKLSEVHPEMHQVADKLVEPETPLFASFLAHFTVNEIEARTALENEAKKAMQNRSTSSIEHLFAAVLKGDLDFFIQYVMEIKPDPLNLKEVTRFNNAKIIVRSWMHDVANKAETTISSADMRAIYLTLFPEKDISPSKFASMLSKNGIDVKRVRDKNGVRVTGFKTIFTLEEYNDPELIKTLSEHNASEISVH